MSPEDFGILDSSGQSILGGSYFGFGGANAAAGVVPVEFLIPGGATFVFQYAGATFEFSEV